MGSQGGTVKKFSRICTVLVLLFACTTEVYAQNSATASLGATPEPEKPLVLTEAIPLEGIKGRFDHFGTSGKQLFVSALGNNTVEVIDISGRTLEHTITGVPNPQGVVYAPEANKLFVGSSKGKLYIYDGTSFDLITEIEFHGDVDRCNDPRHTKNIRRAIGRPSIHQES